MWSLIRPGDPKPAPAQAGGYFKAYADMHKL
jgi:hypothetical protein